MKGELTRGLCPGKCRTATARKTVLKVFLPSDTCWKIPLKVLPKLKPFVLQLFFFLYHFRFYGQRSLLGYSWATKHTHIHTLFFLYFGCPGSSLLRHRLSLVAVSRGYPSLRCMGLSLGWLLLLQSTGSRWAGFSGHGRSSCGVQAQLPCGMWDFPDQGPTHVPCIGRPAVSHWTTRGTLYQYFLSGSFLFFLTGTTYRLYWLLPIPVYFWTLLCCIDVYLCYYIVIIIPDFEPFFNSLGRFVSNFSNLLKCFLSLKCDLSS